MGVISKEVILSLSPKGDGACGRQKSVEAEVIQMVEQGVATLFVNGELRYQDPRIILLDRLMGKIPKMEQITLITEVLKQPLGCSPGSEQEEQSVELVNALEKLFGDDKIGLRSSLREIYTGFPSGADSPLKPRQAVLSKIFQSWSPNGLIIKDVKECFQFICEAYKAAPYNSAPPRGELAKAIITIIRGHLDQSFSEYHWPPQSLDYWIIQRDVPESIAMVLLHFQLNTGGVSMARKRIELVGREREGAS